MYYQLPGPQIGGTPESGLNTPGLAEPFLGSLNIVRRNLDVREFIPKCLEDYGLDQQTQAFPMSEIYTFIQTGDLSVLPQYMVPIIDQLDVDLNPVTRNFSFYNTQTGKIIVINGFGLGEISKNRIEYSQPDETQTYNDYMRSRNPSQDLEYGSIVVGPDGKVTKDVADSPLGGFTLDNVTQKALRMVEMHDLLASEMPDVSTPELLSVFRYGDYSDVYGLIYQMDPTDHIFVPSDTTDIGLVADYMVEEFAFIRRLFRLGWIHNQLHGGNKGRTMTRPARLSISDCESYYSLEGYSEIAKYSALMHALAVAVNTDISVLTYASRKTRTGSRDKIADQNYNLFLERAVRGLIQSEGWLSEDTAIETVKSRINNKFMSQGYKYPNNETGMRQLGLFATCSALADILYISMCEVPPSINDLKF